MPEVVEEVVETVKEVVEQLQEAAVNVTAKPQATPEGMAIAYGSLVVMALVPIYFGAFRSVKRHVENQVSGEKTEKIMTKDAAMFPLFASAALFGLYLVFRIFSKEYINMLLTVYFFVIGIAAFVRMLSPIVAEMLPASIQNHAYDARLTRVAQGEGKTEKDDSEVFQWDFNTADVICFALSAVFGLWYMWQKHWIANNVFGLAFALTGIEILNLNKVVTGCILLGGLFVYDIFWVFGTNVMVTVAKSFEAPIKVVFPQDLLEHGLSANNFAMLGLGDIVIPGIFISLLLRFDVSLKRGRNTYFNVTFIAYIAGLLTTIFVMHVFKHAQPALLYLVPACLGAPLFVALIKGDLPALFQYEDEPEGEEEEKEKAKAGKTD
jgi:minor histocompatibility antigen H13